MERILTATLLETCGQIDCSQAIHTPKWRRLSKPLGLGLLRLLRRSHFLWSWFCFITPVGFCIAVKKGISRRKRAATMVNRLMHLRLLFEGAVVSWLGVRRNEKGGQKATKRRKANAKGDGGLVKKLL